MNKFKRFAKWHGWPYVLFWSWNVIFIIFFSMGFAPFALLSTITAVTEGLIPAQFVIFGVGVVALPIVSAVLALTKFAQSPSRLLTYFYCVEGPLLFLLVVRFFTIQEANPAVSFLLAVCLMGIAGMFWHVMRQVQSAPGDSTARSAADFLRLIGVALFGVAALYVCLWFAFYVPPMVVGLARLVIQMFNSIVLMFQEPSLLRSGILVSTLTSMSFGFTAWILALLSGSLLVVAPILVPILAAKTWHSHARPMGLVGGLVSLFVAAFFIVGCAITSLQPQLEAQAVLDKTPSTPAEARAMMENSPVIREGLTNAYLAPMRYWSATGDVTHVTDMYRDLVGLPEASARAVQNVYDMVAFPVLYRPMQPAQAAPAQDSSASRWNREDVLRRESALAAETYLKVMDKPILQGERNPILSAAASTWSGDMATQALRNIDERNVHIDKQAVSVTPAAQAGWADVEIYEAYSNQTSQRQEVVYYFSLPESAVVTGIWLGDTDDRAKRFVYQVAPRGAAQQTYKNEVQMRIDPALIEQIGPRQYRLRIFPIEARQIRWQENGSSPAVEPGALMHFWMTYRAPEINGAWALPSLVEKRNAYWDAKTIRTYNGAPATAEGHDWLPYTLKASASADPALGRSEKLSETDAVLVRKMSAENAPALPSGLRLAVIADRSASMAAHADELRAALNALAKVKDAKVEVFLSASKYHGEPAVRMPLAGFDPARLVFVGGQNPAELLLQFDGLRGGDAFDAVLALTDDSGYDMNAAKTKPPELAAPVMMVHLGGKLPLGYDDATLQAIQASGGGSVDTLSEALTRLAVKLEKPINGVVTQNYADGYLWQTIPAAQAATRANYAPAQTPSPEAARYLIMAKMQQSGKWLSALDNLDALHKIAVQSSIVTPYSSMIVLVNDAQRKRLAELEKQADRFDREFEEVGTTNQTPVVTGVPEPEEWLLMGLATLACGWLLAKKRRESKMQAI